MKTFKPRLKARLRKNRQVLNKNIDNFYGWVKGAKLVELKECNTEEDPVRPELDNEFRTGYGRKIYGVEYQGEIHAVMCFAYTNKIPKSVDELEKLSTDAFLQSAMRDQSGGQIAIAYTVWPEDRRVVVSISGIEVRGPRRCRAGEQIHSFITMENLESHRSYF